MGKFLKKSIKYLLKLIIAVMMGIGSSMGRGPVNIEKKENKTIESEK
jgi:hypothetical protein